MYVQISDAISSLKVLQMAAYARMWPRETSWHLLPIGALLPSYSSAYIHTEGRILPTSLEGNEVLHRLGVCVTLAISSCHLFFRMWAGAVVTLLHNSFKVTAFTLLTSCPLNIIWLRGQEM